MESDLKSDYDLQSASTGCETRLDLFENRLFSIKLTLPYAFEYISFYTGRRQSGADQNLNRVPYFY